MTSEEWADGMTAGALSRYILWAYPALNAANNRHYKNIQFKQNL